MKKSDLMKISVLSYFRYKRRMTCATEVSGNYGISDVLCISKDGTKIVDVEIKISIQDLKADFKNKQSKHKLLPEGMGLSNYFYFCVPKDILEETQNIVGRDNKYGILLWNPVSDSPDYLLGEDDITVVKSAKDMGYRRNAEKTARHNLNLRLSSEVILDKRKLLESERKHERLLERR